MQSIRKWSTNVFSLVRIQLQPTRLTSTSQPSEFLSANLANGVGRYVCQLQRITFKFCKEHPSSRGIRFLLFAFFVYLVFSYQRNG